MKRVSFLLVFLTACYANAQDFEATVIKPLSENQLFFEKVFVHTNKMTYWLDDTIWFKAYVVSNENLPSSNTTLLYVNLLDSEGYVLESRNVLINQGVGIGQFELKGDLKSGTYFLQSYTNYMRNFGDHNYYSQKITILNEPRSAKDSTNLKPVYDVQILPEGGYLLDDAENVVGIKSLINNQGVAFSGQILDSQNRKVAAFNSMHLGMTKCKFYNKAAESYTAKIVINDTIIKKKLPVARKTGIALQVLSDLRDTLQIDLRINKNSVDENNRAYTILFHQKHKLIDYAKVILNDTSKMSLAISKLEFPNGVNTLTIFNDRNQPILERKFFIDRSDKSADMTLTKEGVLNDSINYKLRVETHSSSKKPLSHLSVSVLSIHKDFSLRRSVNIKSAFLLSPYLKGHIENPGYYFNEKFKNRLKYLDLLLLNQGWVKYSNEEMIAELNPKYSHDFELGFSLKGTTSPLYTNHLALMTDKDEIIDKINLDGNSQFSFDKLLVYKGDKVKLSFVTMENEAIKPRSINIDSMNYSHLPFKANRNARSIFKSETDVDLDLWKDFYSSDATLLETVNVVGKKRSEAYMKRRRLINKYRKITFDIGKYMVLDIPQIDIDKRKDLMQYLLHREGVILKHLNGEWFMQVGYMKEAVLYIDGERVFSEELSGLSLSLEDIENIMMQPYKGNKIFQVFTTDNYKKGIVELFQGFIILNGYDKSKHYYTPLIDNGVLPIKEVDWKPMLETNKDGLTFFKIKKNKDEENLMFIVEGVSIDGHLISDSVGVD